jgi:uncharacterized membrane protein YhaH (DUF805 family)
MEAIMNKRVGFLGALGLFFRNYINVMDYSSRREYWYVTLWQWLYQVVMIIWLIFSMFSTIAGGAKPTPELVLSVAKWPLIIAVVVSVVTLVPIVTLHIRRFRDAGLSPLWLVLTLGGPLVFALIGSFTAWNWPAAVALVLIVLNLVLAAKPTKGLHF